MNATINLFTGPPKSLPANYFSCDALFERFFGTSLSPSLASNRYDGLPKRPKHEPSAMKTSLETHRSAALITLTPTDDVGAAGGSVIA